MTASSTRVTGRARLIHLALIGGLTLYSGHRLYSSHSSEAIGGVVVTIIIGVLAYFYMRKPRFELSDTGVTYPWIEGEVRWDEIESMTIRYIGEGGRGLLLQPRDPRALASRVTRGWRPLAILYRPLGLMSWFTVIGASNSPLPLEQLADEIERRAGRTLRV